MVLPKSNSVCFTGRADYNNERRVYSSSEKLAAIITLVMRVRFPTITVEVVAPYQVTFSDFARGFEMWRILILIIVLSASNLFSQTAEKPKAFLFDEFEVIPDREIRSRTQRLREKIHEKAWSNEPLSAYVVVYHPGANGSTKRLEKLMIDALFDQCYDCMGFGPRITFIRGGKAKRQKVQFWLIPSGAEPPKIDLEQN
jgi:hypothetical protein